MLVPINWLKKYIEIDMTAEELAEKLTASGSSVERIYEVGQGLDDLIVGEVLEVKPHPNADRLRLASVNTGSETVEVVCGAPNLAAGQRIVYASTGSRIPVNMHDEARQPFVLKKATIRGVESNGMICSVAEMGIGDDHEGILVLPDDTEIGKPVTEALDYPQTVLDIEVTTNRSDELSLYGIAREVSALTGKPLIDPEIVAPATTAKSGLEPKIQTDQCWRLLTQQLQVTVGPSPWWMQQQLSLAGMRPVNNVVDITNFVMMELGQPLHAYDLTRLSGQSLFVRETAATEKMQTLDGVERSLPTGTMVITDDQNILGVAGIMGGEASKITDSTTEIVLEAAAFNPVSIRKTANELALRSEASRRFERTVDREMTELALARTVTLLKQYANARQIGQRRNSYPQPLEPKQITLTSRKLEQYLGKHIDPLVVRKILKSLGFGDTSAFGKDEDWELAVRVPSWRASDIQEEVDLIEEVVRILGYDQIPINLPGGVIPDQQLNYRYYNQVELKHALARAGWMEMISPSLIGADLQQSMESELPTVRLSNPLSADMTHMRASLLPGMIAAAKRNIRNQPQLQLFELSEVFEAQKGKLPTQNQHLGLLSTSGQNGEAVLTQVKGIIALALEKLGVDVLKIDYVADTGASAPLDAQNSARIEVAGEMIGWMGKIRRQIGEAMDLPPQTIVAEIEIGSRFANTATKQLQPLPKFPALTEDISLIISEETPVATVQAQIESAAGKLLESAQLIEIYRHASIGQNKKSVTFHLTYRADDRTLSSKEVASTRQKLIAALQKEGVNVRS